MQDPDISQKDKEPGGWGFWKALPAGPLSICMPLKERVVVCLFPAVPSPSPCGAQVALVHSLQMDVLLFRVEVKRIWEASLLLIYPVENFIFQPGPANQ